MRRHRGALHRVLPMLVFASVFLVFTPRASTPGPYRIDEAHKVGETYFLHLVLAGRLRHSDWFRDIVDRTNPPVGKYLFGLSILLHGQELPPDLALARSGLAAVQPPPELAAQYRPALIAARRVSVFATALTAAILWVAAARLHGLLAAAAAVALYLTNFLTLTFATTAVFDPLLTCAMTATVLPLVRLWSAAEREWIWAAAAGALSGIAFQIRATGLIALAVTIVIAIVAAIRRRALRPLLAAALAVVVCFIVATAVNPFYWAAPQDRFLPPEITAQRSLPTRIWSRYAIQFRDQQSLLAENTRGGSGLPLRGRAPFVLQTAAGDWPGMLMLLGCGMTIFFLVRERREYRDRLLFAIFWGVSLVGAVVLWLPVPWPRYALSVVPPLALLGGIGWANLLTLLRTARAKAAE